MDAPVSSVVVCAARRTVDRDQDSEASAATFRMPQPAPIGSKVPIFISVRSDRWRRNPDWDSLKQLPSTAVAVDITAPSILTHQRWFIYRICTIYLIHRRGCRPRNSCLHSVTSSTAASQAMLRVRRRQPAGSRTAAGPVTRYGLKCLTHWVSRPLCSHRLRSSA